MNKVLKNITYIGLLKKRTEKRKKMISPARLRFIIVQIVVEAKLHIGRLTRKPEWRYKYNGCKNAYSISWVGGKD